MDRLNLTGTEIADIHELIARVLSTYAAVDAPDFLHDAGLLAHDMPQRVRRLLNNFRMVEPADGACLISGWDIDDVRLGTTPTHWKWEDTVPRRSAEDVLLVLLGSLLGDVFGWLTQQDGHIVHEIMPIREHDDEQIETGSRQELIWHTDDAFHPYRADYIGMMCLRNPDKIPTTFGYFDAATLPPDYVDVLFKARFLMRPDDSHLESNRSDLDNHVLGNRQPVDAAYKAMNSVNFEPGAVALLEGDHNSPYIRIDPCTTTALDNDLLAKMALDALVQQISGTLVDVVLSPGDVIFLDNKSVVHGRRPFSPRHDGHDRWLKRVGVTRDLRKSRGDRSSATSRLIQ